MKKFFGLKMTLAALAVVSFASCYDSEGGDVIIPNQTSVVFPAPVYVVNGTVTNWNNGTVMSGVKVGGVITPEQTTDANGQFSVKLTSPVKGNVEFTYEGYFKSLRSLDVVAMTTGSAVYTVDAVMLPTDNVWGIRQALREKDVTSEAVEAEAKEATAAQMAAIEDIYGEIFTNDSEVAKTYDVPAAFFAAQKYGMLVTTSKSFEEDGKAALYKLGMSMYGVDPFGGKWGEYTGTYVVNVPASSIVTGIKITPIKVNKTIVIPFEDGDYEQAVEVIDTYKAEVTAKSIAHDHGHGHGNGNGAGGGEGN